MRQRNVRPEDRPTTGLPHVVEVIDALEFPCPHEGCPRHTDPYTDGNRLTHHLRVIHDIDPPERLDDLTGPSMGEVLHRAAGGTIRAVKVG